MFSYGIRWLSYIFPAGSYGIQWPESSTWAVFYFRTSQYRFSNSWEWETRSDSKSQVLQCPGSSKKRKPQ
jgi:hypothetical protein